MNSKIWLFSGLLIIVASFFATVYYVDQIMGEMIKAQNEGTASPNLDFNAAVASGILIGAGFILVIVGLIKRSNEKKIVNQ